MRLIRVSQTFRGPANRAATQVTPSKTFDETKTDEKENIAINPDRIVNGARIVRQ